jgi:hypothetical protein
LIKESVESLLPVERSLAEEAIIGSNQVEERWVDEEKNHLIIINENDTWNIYFGLNLEESFDTYGEAEEFLQEEGFRRV